MESNQEEETREYPTVSREIHRRNNIIFLNK